MSSCVKTSTTLTKAQVPAEENQPQSITLPPWSWCPGDVQCCRNYGYKVQHLGPTCFLITWCTRLQNVYTMSCHYSPFSTRPLLARNSCSSPNAAVGLSAASRPVFFFSLRFTSFNYCFLMLLWKKRTGHCVENIRPFLIIDSHIRNTGKLYICNLS